VNVFKIWGLILLTPLIILLAFCPLLYCAEWICFQRPHKQIDIIQTALPATTGGFIRVATTPGTSRGLFSSSNSDREDITPDQGDVIYYDGSVWTTLNHETSGQFLQTDYAVKIRNGDRYAISDDALSSLAISNLVINVGATDQNDTANIAIDNFYTTNSCEAELPW
jgi:hypothetical protein